MAVFVVESVRLVLFLVLVVSLVELLRQFPKLVSLVEYKMDKQRQSKC